MAFTPFTLPKATKLFRTTPAGVVLSLDVPAGTVVRHERTETETHHVLSLRYRYDGFNWERVQEREKEGSDTPPPSNGNGHVSLVAPARDRVVLSEEQREDVESTHRAQREVRKLNRERKILTGKMYQVNYYIPTRCSDEGFKNPCRALKMAGAYHLDGSNFMVPEKVLERERVKRVFASFAAFKPIEEPSTLDGMVDRIFPWIDKVELTPEQVAQMRERVVTRLAQKLKDAHRSLLVRIDKADKALREATEKLSPTATAKDRDVLANVHNTALRATLKDAFAEYEHCLNGAAMFDDRSDDEDSSLDVVFEACRAAIYTTALGVNILFAARRVKGVEVPKVVADPTINPWQTQR